MRIESRTCRRFAAAALVVAAALVRVPPAGAQPAPGPGSCVACHAALPDGRLSAPAVQFSRANVHREARLGCADCHGGDPAAGEKIQAHATTHAFKGTPIGEAQITGVCGTCHGAFVERFQKSTHSEIFDKGCVECHGSHAVLRPSDEMLGTAAGTMCGMCHGGPGDKGAVSADRMRSGLDRLKGAIAGSASLIARIGNAGIEVGREELAIGEARSRLTLARTELHSSDAGRVEAVIDEGLGIVANVEAAGQKGLSELRYRKRGLAFSLGAILLLVAALWLKVRQIDRRDAAAGVSQRQPPA